jgi:hypothetical protein
MGIPLFLIMEKNSYRPPNVNSITISKKDASYIITALIRAIIRTEL